MTILQLATEHTLAARALQATADALPWWRFRARARLDAMVSEHICAARAAVMLSEVFEP